MAMDKTLTQPNAMVTNLSIATPQGDQSVAPVRTGGKLAFGLIWLFTFVYIARPEDMYPAIGALHLTLGLGIGAAIVFFGTLLTGRVKLQMPRELKLVLMLTGWFILGVPFAFWRTGSLFTLIDVWFRTLLFFFLLTQNLTTIGRVRKIIWVVLISELVTSAYSILNPTAGTLDSLGRMVGVNKGMLGWNFLGITVAVTLPYVASLYVSGKSVLRTALLAAVVGATMWMLVLTASRGGFIGVVLSLILTWWFVLRGSARSRVVVFVVAACLVFGLAEAPAVFWDRLGTIWGSSSEQIGSTAAAATTTSADESTESRERLLLESSKDTFEHPILGLGLSGFAIYNGAEGSATGWYGTHNTFTQLSSEAGIPALILLILILRTVIRHMKFASDKFADDPDKAELRLLTRATLVGTLMFIFSGFFSHIGYDCLLYFVVGISTGLWAIASQADGSPEARAESPVFLPELSPTKWVPKWR